MARRLPPFQAVLEAHGASVHRYLVASVGHTDADDCFQETAIAALRAYPKLRHADNLQAWLMRIAHNKAIDSHRARGRRAIPVESVPERAAAREPVPALDGEPELWAAVRELPPKQRGAVFLRSVIGASYEDVGRVLECSPEAARRSVHEGLAKLRERFPGGKELGDG
jgi:RNA polymerase sigma factor (sigma-70 family)